MDVTAWYDNSPNNKYNPDPVADSPLGRSDVPGNDDRILQLQDSGGPSRSAEGRAADARSRAVNPQRLKIEHGLIRGLGLLEATALNMSNMVGVGPFITIPLIIASMGGPQCMLGWVLGAVIALCDGLVWSELAASMPATGGTYVYLREAFKKTIWAAFCRSCLSGNSSSADRWRSRRDTSASRRYVGYFWPGMSAGATRAVSMSVGVLVIVLLYRRVTSIGKLTVVLWVGHADHGAVGDFRGPDAFQFESRVRFSAQRVSILHRVRGRARVGHADRDVRFHGLLRHLLCGRRGAESGARDPSVDHLFGAGASRRFMR